MNISKDFLWFNLRDLPYFRALIRAVEAGFYQTIEFPHPILDVGTGDGHFLSIAFEGKVDIGIDSWREPILEAQQRDKYCSLIQSDGGQIPFPKNYFSSAISNSVLEHIPHIDRVLLEVNRVLKPNALFIFCVPNPGYLNELSIPKLFEQLGLKRLAILYRDWFRRMSRVEHAEPPNIWKTWLENSGFSLEKCWNYFSPEALRVLEWGHYFGLPSLICKKIFGRWVIAPTRWNLFLVEMLLRPYSIPTDNPDGTFTFYIARKI